MTDGRGFKEMSYYDNNDNFEYSNNSSSSIYTDEDYEKLTGGKYGSEIFVPHDNEHDSNFIDELELKSSIQNEDFFEYTIKTINKTVKCEDVLIKQILHTGLSSYIQDDPINLGIMAPTSEGKTYPVEECIKYFPKQDIYKVGSMSAKVLVRERGILVDGRNLNPIEEKLKDLRRQKNKTKDQDEKEKIIEEIEKLYENAKTLIDLRGKILIFLEPPHKEVWDILKPILSHDSLEIEFPFVNQTDREGHQTKKVVVRGWPSCIFCSARDESKWEIWPEIKSRCLITSPNMIPKKYQESTKLISLTYGLPNIIQQQKIISEEEIDQTKQCILLLKQKIQELRSQNNNDNGGKISIWIPYAQLLEKELPSNKGTDVRFQKRIFSLLRIVPIVKVNHRKLLVFENQTSIIADLDDLKEVLSITQNFDGIPKFKTDFFTEIFYPCYKEKREPDSNTDGKKTEEIIAVTTRELCDCFKEIKKKPISTDNLKHTYINQLINEGIIDYTESKINSRQNIYYPLVTDSLSIESIMSPIDKNSQLSSTIYEKIIKNTTEEWIFCEIMRLIRYRLDLTDFDLAEYLNNEDEFQLLDSQEYGERLLAIGEFTQKYNTEKVLSSIDNKRSNILLNFAKRSPFLSILAKIDQIDKKDITTKNSDTEKASNTITEEQLESSSLPSSSSSTNEQSLLMSCNHCSYQGKSENEVLVHSVNAHPGLPARPDPSLLELMQKENKDEK